MSQIYDETSIREKYHILTKYLIEKGLTITTMESATSGQLASLITDTEGASKVFKGAFITYCNEAKIMQGVPKEVIEKYSVYSTQTAEAMAKVCKQAYGADIAIGITGTMGNVDLDNEAFSSPGQVYIGFVIFGETKSYHISLPPQSSRLMYKLAVAKEVYDLLSDNLDITEGN